MVGFRAFTHRIAAGLELAGWVRNLPDGCVEFEAEGAPDRVAEFLARVREGPRMAVVEALDLTLDQEPASLPPRFRFEIRF